jgi:hypothetical protein
MVAYREKRLRELSQQAKRARFGEVITISSDSFRQVDFTCTRTCANVVESVSGCESVHCYVSCKCYVCLHTYLCVRFLCILCIALMQEVTDAADDELRVVVHLYADNTPGTESPPISCPYSHVTMQATPVSCSLLNCSTMFVFSIRTAQLHASIHTYTHKQPKHTSLTQPANSAHSSLDMHACMSPNVCAFVCVCACACACVCGSECQVVDKLLRAIAKSHPHTKFARIFYLNAIPNYPPVKLNP